MQSRLNKDSVNEFMLIMKAFKFTAQNNDKIIVRTYLSYE